MVPLDIVNSSNAQLRELGPGLVALFVGATSGIGEWTAKAFVKNSTSPHVYIVGRNAEAAERIINECKTLNADGRVEFLKADVSELREVDRICAEILKKEKKLNLIVQTQGNLNFRGRDENGEGLDRKLTLNYYSRMRFITNLLPLLRTATTTTPNFARSLSVLGAGHEGKLNFDDLDLKNSFSAAKCANHSTTMNDFMAEELAAREPGISFLQSSPGVAMTGVATELPLWARVGIKALTPVLKMFAVGADETGARQLFLATSGMYPPATPAAGFTTACGVTLSKSVSVLTGLNGKVGSGAYAADWDGKAVGNRSILDEYHAKGVGKIVWEHTMGIFEKVK